MSIFIFFLIVWVLFWEAFSLWVSLMSSIFWVVHSDHHRGVDACLMLLHDIIQLWCQEDKKFTHYQPLLMWLQKKLVNSQSHQHKMLFSVCLQHYYNTLPDFLWYRFPENIQFFWRHTTNNINIPLWFTFVDSGLYFWR